MNNTQNNLGNVLTKSHPKSVIKCIEPNTSKFDNLFKYPAPHDYIDKTTYTTVVVLQIAQFGDKLFVEYVSETDYNKSLNTGNTNT